MMSDDHVEIHKTIALDSLRRGIMTVQQLQAQADVDPDPLYKEGVRLALLEYR